QSLMGIKNDGCIGHAIQRGHFTPREVAVAYGNQADNAVSPALEPFRPCWEDLRSPWNLALEDLFVDRFRDEHPEHTMDQEYIRTRFRQRLETMRDAIMVQVRQLGRPDLQRKKFSRNRRRERRRVLFRRRKAWASDNLETMIQADGHDTVELLLQMVSLLGTDGMSTDESANESDNNLCTVSAKDWRSPDIIRLLKWIDLHRPRHTAYGEQMPGNRPHRRLRLPHGKAPTSLRRPIANLPINFYNPVWLQGLSPARKRHLGATQARPLPLYVLTWPANSLPENKDDQDDY
ncbi:hypothetical protein R3P38DRAFT_2545937, partial [Favolaschia claudopus]